MHWVRRYRQEEGDPEAPPASQSSGPLVELKTAAPSPPRTSLTADAFSANEPSSTELLLNWALN